jgi:hypothetical protein
MVFKFAQAAEKSRRRLKGYNLLPKVALAAKFNHGMDVVGLSATISSDFARVESPTPQPNAAPPHYAAPAGLIESPHCG